MQITIVGWELVAFGGLGIFAMKYLLPSSAPAVAVVASPTPSAAPSDTPAPTATPVPPTATPSEASGAAAIVDDRAISDRVNVDLFNVPQPPASSVYEGWLIGNNGEFRLSLGVLTAGADGRVTHTFTSPIGENLLANYDEFVMTVEPANDSDPQPSADIKFSAVVPAGTLPALRAMMVSAGDAPGQVGYAVGLRAQADLIMQHVSLTDLATDAQELAGFHRHGEHLVNLIEGLHGPNFGDVDGDGRVLNPGDGYGLISTPQGLGYIDAVIAHAETAIAAPDASEQVKLHAEHVIIGAQNARAWAEQIDAKALEMARAPDTATAQALLDEMRPLAEALLNGVDADGNGSVDPIPGEGTVYLAYVHGQFASSPAYDAPLLEGGAPIVVAQATPTPTAPPPTPVPTPEPQVLQVLMKDFAFGPATITIKAGTTVEFINLDNAPHTATTDDNSKDTGTLNLNDKATLIFDTPGEFPYFCLFHGGPGGAGMAARIIVEP
jgi:plastocyanin